MSLTKVLIGKKASESNNLTIQGQKTIISTDIADIINKSNSACSVTVLSKSFFLFNNPDSRG